jgi:AcrR family transcriptional regulator
MSSAPKPPIWARPEPRGRGRRAPLSRAQIVRTALKIADEEGLEAVSIRRIARELRSGAMSLYHYFDSRDELLELMGDTVAGEMLVPKLPSDWRAALKAIASAGRETFKRHPWLLATLQERPTLSPNTMRHVEQSSQAVRALGEEGHDPALLTALVLAVDDYMLGYTMRELVAGDPEDRARGLAKRVTRDADDPNVRYLLESGEFPMLSMFLERGGQLPLGDRFEQGLDWLLDGFAAQLHR